MLHNQSQYSIKIGCAFFVIFFSVIGFQNPSYYKDTIPFEYKHLTNPTFYVLEKLSEYDIVFLGTNHSQKNILTFISTLLPKIHGAGVSHIGLEIASDQQASIDDYMENGIGLNRIKLHHVIDSPAYRDLFRIIRQLGPGKKIKPVALDLPLSLYQSSWNRDEWMAKSICEVLDQNANAKILVIVGNLHALKNIVWNDDVPRKTGVIRSYLSQVKPHLKTFSICQSITETPCENSISNNLTEDAILVTFDCIGRFSNYELGILKPVAAKPMKAYEITDGVLTYWGNRPNSTTPL
jgi:hypothetical protein